MDEGNGFVFSYMAPNLTAAIVLIIAITSILIRVFYVIYWTGNPVCRTCRKSLSTLVVLGSGGHTAEMLNLLLVLQKDMLTPRFYIAAATDNMSLQQAHVYESSLDDTTGKNGIALQFVQIYRSREVGLTYISSVWTTLIAMAHELWLKTRPQVLFCNGPGTCVSSCIIAFLFKMVGIRWSSIFYVESIARVRRFLSSGLILFNLHIVDELFVR